MTKDIPAYLQGVKAIGFDIWGTLLGGNRAFTGVRLQTIAHRLGLDIPAEDLRQAYRESERVCNDRAEATGVDGGMSERLAFIYSLLGINAPLPDAKTIYQIHSELGRLRCQPKYVAPLIEPDLPGTLDELGSDGFKLALLSNTGMDGGPVMRPLMAHHGILQRVSFAMFSAEEGVAKPNPEIFRRFASRLGVEPSEVLYVGDNPVADREGPLGVGLKSVVFVRKTVDIPPDAPTITCISELPDLLRRARALALATA